ncbi:hypothetical protein KUTeg_010232 [Tegillarca granosa]|uniref:RGS domain-containing protein n=1 Tax=Tegillarca granosa TaxID=220873 RepID=A0ABQ9F656_TEGGR|nr:hypothetical protein KUTeg_010232 [Tegillarca granosa]
MYISGFRSEITDYYWCQLENSPIKRFEKIETDEERIKLGKEIYDQFIMKELLSQSHEQFLQTYSKAAVDMVQEALTTAQRTKKLQPLIFEPYIEEICNSLRGHIFDKFIESEKYTRFCQWKNLELNIQLTMNDFSVHRIIGRGGFGEVYGCRKADTGKIKSSK